MTQILFLSCHWLLAETLHFLCLVSAYSCLGSVTIAVMPCTHAGTHNVLSMVWVSPKGTCAGSLVPVWWCWDERWWDLYEAVLSEKWSGLCPQEGMNTGLAEWVDSFKSGLLWTWSVSTQPVSFPLLLHDMMQPGFLTGFQHHMVLTQKLQKPPRLMTEIMNDL
jgi:hypothetical protein